MQERSSKIIAIVALCVGVVGLSLGFAAFSASLTVESGATVSVNEADVFTLTVADLACKDQANETVSTGSIVNNGKNAVSVTGISAAFTAPGQSLTCTLTVTSPNFAASLTSASTNGGKVSCGEELTTNQTAACDAIDVTVKHEATALGTIDTATALANTTSGAALAKNTPSTVEFKIEYPAGSQIPDGNLTVEIPSVVFTYEVNA